MKSGDQKPRRRGNKTKNELARGAEVARNYRARLSAAGVPTAREIDAALAMLMIKKMHTASGLHLIKDNRADLVGVILRFADCDINNEMARNAIEHRIEALRARTVSPKRPPFDALSADSSLPQTDS